MLIDYLTVAAVLATVFIIMVMSTRGWEVANTKECRSIILLASLIWPIIVVSIMIVALTIACAFLFVMVNEWMER